MSCFHPGRASCLHELTYIYSNKLDSDLFRNSAQVEAQCSRPMESSESTLNSPVYKECPWAVSDIVEPAIVTVLQNPQEEEHPQPAARPQVSGHIIH